MNDARVFVSIEHLPDDLVAPVKATIDTWAADRPHVTDLEVIRWTAPAQGDANRAAEWQGGLYLHSTEVTVGDIIAIRDALAPYAPTKISALHDSAAQ